MADKDKVIKGLECCFKYETHAASGLVCEECPYNKDNHLGTCTAWLFSEALELLKEQEPLVIHKCGFTATCPECNLSWMMWQPDYMRYCPYCGKAVKRDETD